MVVGLGGAGGNAVDNMIRAKLEGVEFVVANTDAQALEQSACARRVQLGRIIGGHITGPEAGELIHQLIAIMYYNGTVGDVLNMPHYHPTLSEIITYPAEALAAKIG